MKRALSSSNLASETPMRVRSNSSGGSTSGSKFSCQRSSLRKSAVGVSRFSIGRPSIGGSSRRSSAQDGGKKDIRSQTDKESTKRNLQILSNFLQDPSIRYPYIISPKLAVGPSAKDVTNMFEFLVKLIIPDYEEGKKFEDEFPRVLKMLGFPFTVAKRNLQPVATLHNWPTILYGLSWLCSSAKYNIDLDEEPLVLTGDSQDCLVKRYTDKLYQECYMRFMSGSDEFNDVCDKFIGDLPDVINGMEQVKRVEELKLRFATLVEERNSLLEVQRELQKGDERLANDVTVLAEYLQNLTTFSNSKEKEISSLQLDLIAKDKQIEDLQASIKTKEDVIKNQRMSPEEVQLLSVKLMGLTSQVTVSREALKQIREEFNEKSTAVAKIEEKVLLNIEEYHTATSACGMTPSTAANAQGYDYSIRSTNFDSDVLYADIQGTVGRLNLIVKQWKEASRESKAAEMHSLENLTLIEQSLANKRSEEIDMEAQIQREQESIELTKIEHAKELSSYQTELTTIEEECNSIRKTTIKATEEIESLDVQKKVKLTELAKIKSCLDDEMSESNTFQVAMCELFLEHKETLEAKMIEFQQRIQLFANKWRNIDVNSIKLENVPDVGKLKMLQQEMVNKIRTMTNESEADVKLGNFSDSRK